MSDYKYIYPASRVAILIATLAQVASAGAFTSVAHAADDGASTAVCANGSCPASSDVVVGGTGNPADAGLSVDAAAGAHDECAITGRNTRAPCFGAGAITARHTPGIADGHFRGAKIEAGVTSNYPIDLDRVCRFIDKDDKANQYNILVPFNSPTEWKAFAYNAQKGSPGLLLVSCIRGGLVNLPAIYGTVGATNQCETVTSTPNPQQVLSPYHRPAFNSWTSPTVTYSCASPDGTAFTETVTGSYIGAVATDGDPSIGWTLDPTRGGISTVFDGVCGAAAGGTGASTAPTTGLCHVGVPSTITLDTTNNLFTWSCAAGSGGGTPAACQTPYSPSGCSPATVANGTVGSSPTCTVTCDSGYALSADGKSCTASCPAPYTMECHVTGFDDGSNGGKSTTCQCSNAYCGTAQGEASGTAPSSNLCLNGSTPTVSVNAGNWTWSCGFKQQCNAPVLCNPSSVANGTVNADCSITCDSGYNLSGDGKSCSAADPVGCCSSCPDYGTSIGCIYFPSTLSNCPTINTNGWIGEMWGPQNCGPVCNPASVANGTVNPVDCSINCNSGYALSSDGQSCNASPAPDGCVSVCGDFYSDGQTWCEPSGFGYICVNGRKMSDGQLSCKKGWAC